MVKVQAQAGNSLADVYDVRGSVAGIEQLETQELPIVHEMGGTVFSERLSGNIQRLSGTLAQNLTLDTTLDLSGADVRRIFGVAVITDAVARVDHLALLIGNSADTREIPIWAWDTTIGTHVDIRMMDNGAAVADHEILIPIATGCPLPSFSFGDGQPQRMDRIIFRGLTAGFGAGDVTMTALIYTAFGFRSGGLSSRGLPVPSW